MKKPKLFVVFAMLKKKLILVAGFKSQTEKKVVENVQAKIDGAEANPTFVTLTPTIAIVQSKVDEVNDLFDLRKAKEDELKLINQKIVGGLKWLKDTITDKWMPTTQTAIADDEDKATALSYSWRGKLPVVAPEVSVWNSHPVVLEVINSGNLMHTIHVVNNVTEDWKIPEDAECCYLFMTFTEADAGNLKKMTFLGEMKKGKFVNHFAAEDRKKDVWYVAVYKAKTGDTQPELSGTVKATVL